jgi:hypothetical protein
MPGVSVSGVGGQGLNIEGRLDQVNAELATLTDTVSSSSSDILVIAAADSLGQSKVATVDVVVSGLALYAPPNITAEQGAASTALAEISESGNTPGEIFTVTLSDDVGPLSVSALSESGADISGSDTIHLTITNQPAQRRVASD